MPQSDSAPAWRNQRGLSIGFLTALVADELSPAHGVLKDRGWSEVRPSPEMQRADVTPWVKEVDGVTIHAHSMAINNMGQTISAIETTTFLTVAKPQITFLVGIAGSLNEKDARLRDVIIGTGFFWRALTKISDGDPCPVYRERQMELPKYSTGLARRIARFASERYDAVPDDHERAHQVKAGKIFSWDYVVNSSSIVAELNQSFSEALCVEMEAAGFLSSIERYVEVSKRAAIGFVVRGISDYAASKSTDSAVRNAASHNAAHAAVDLAEWMLTGDHYPVVSQNLWMPPAKPPGRRTF